jgi:hypothetical protein
MEHPTCNCKIQILISVTAVTNEFSFTSDCKIQHKVHELEGSHVSLYVHFKRMGEWTSEKVKLTEWSQKNVPFENC